MHGAERNRASIPRILLFAGEAAKVEAAKVEAAKVTSTFLNDLDRPQPLIDHLFLPNAATRPVLCNAEPANPHDQNDSPIKHASTRLALRGTQKLLSVQRTPATTPAPYEYGNIQININVTLKSVTFVTFR